MWHNRLYRWKHTKCSRKWYLKWQLFSNYWYQHFKRKLSWDLRNYCCNFWNLTFWDGNLSWQFKHTSFMVWVTVSTGPFPFFTACFISVILAKYCMGTECCSELSVALTEIHSQGYNPPDGLLAGYIHSCIPSVKHNLNWNFSSEA